MLVAAGFAFVTAATLRGVHHLAGVPWDEHIGSSMIAQTSLTLVWSVLGVVGWVQGSRRGSRPLWLAGAVLMGIVLAKLLLIDRTHLGSVFGIASFIAYGLLCTVIGYFAPAPPRGGGARDGRWRTRMMRASALLWFCSAMSVAANAPADYAYVFPIETTAHDANAASSAWRVELTPDVYRWVQDADLRDIEVFNAEHPPCRWRASRSRRPTTAREEQSDAAGARTAGFGEGVARERSAPRDRSRRGRAPAPHRRGREASRAATTGRDWLVDASAFDHAIDSLALSWREPASGIVARFAVEPATIWSTGAAPPPRPCSRSNSRARASSGATSRSAACARSICGCAVSTTAPRSTASRRGAVRRAHTRGARTCVDRAAEPCRSDAAEPPRITRFDYTLVAALPVDIARIELASDNALAQISVCSRATPMRPPHRGFASPR